MRWHTMLATNAVAQKTLGRQAGAQLEQLYREVKTDRKKYEGIVSGSIVGKGYLTQELERIRTRFGEKKEGTGRGDH